MLSDNDVLKYFQMMKDAGINTGAIISWPMYGDGTTNIIESEVTGLYCKREPEIGYAEVKYYGMGVPVIKYGTFNSDIKVIQKSKIKVRKKVT